MAFVLNSVAVVPEVVMSPPFTARSPVSVVSPVTVSALLMVVVPEEHLSYLYLLRQLAA